MRQVHVESFIFEVKKKNWVFGGEIVSATNNGTTFQKNEEVVATGRCGVKEGLLGKITGFGYPGGGRGSAVIDVIWDGAEISTRMKFKALQKETV